MNDTKAMRDAAAKKNPEWVTAGLISAIKTLEARQRRERPQLELAQAAYSKLQFDFPDVSLEELRALNAELRTTLSAKAGVCPFHLTSKFVENITEGASYMQAPSSSSATLNAAPPSRVASDATFVSENDRHGTPTTGTLGMKGSGGREWAQDKPLSVAASLQLHPSTGSSGGSRIVYQQLCSTVLLDWVTKLLSLPEEAAWQLLSSFHPDITPIVSDGLGDEAGPLSQQAPEINPQDTNTDPSHTTKTGSGQEGDNTISASTDAACNNVAGPNDIPTVTGNISEQRVYVEVLAEEEDADDVPYEDMPAEPTLSSLSFLNGDAVLLRSSKPASASVPEVVGRGDCYTSQASFSHVSTNASFGSNTMFEPGCNQFPSAQNTSSSSAVPPAPWASHRSCPYSWPALKKTLVALASHTRYSVMCEAQLWAHGSHAEESVMTLLRTLGAHSRSSELQELTTVYVQLLTERLIDAPSDLKLLGALGEALGVQAAAGDATGALAARCRPDQSILSPEVVMILTMLTQLVSRTTNPSHKSLLWQQINTHFLPSIEAGLQRVERAGESHPESLSSLNLLASVMEFYVAAAPRGVREQGLGLGDRGMLRVLCALFERHGPHPGAEPVRRCIVLCAASSAVNLKWLAAVPGVQRALQGSFFAAAAPGEAHGIVWELLLKAGESKQAAAVLSLLHTPSEVLRTLRLLELLAKCQNVQPFGQRLYSQHLMAHMQQEFNQVQKDLITTQAPAFSADSASQADSVSMTATPKDSVTSTGVHVAAQVCDPLPAGAPGLQDAETAAKPAPNSESAGPREENALECAGAADRSIAESTGTATEMTHAELASGPGMWAEDKPLHGGTPEEMREKMLHQVLPACWRLLKDLLLQADTVKKD